MTIEEVKKRQGFFSNVIKTNSVVANAYLEDPEKPGWYIGVQYINSQFVKSYIDDGDDCKEDFDYSIPYEVDCQDKDWREKILDGMCSAIIKLHGLK